MDTDRVTNPCISDFELSQHILRHVVLCEWVDDEVLVPGGPVTRPVLVTLVLHTYTSLSATA